MLNSSFLIAQFPYKTTLQANDGTIVKSPATIKGKSYTITVSGTYSMWPTYNNYGVDAAYLYDVPQEEINALRWPPQKFLNFTFYSLPYWVGNDNEIPNISIPGLDFKFISRDHIGFRYNGNWLQNTGLDPILHRYQVKLIGDGNPINLQILDSSFSISLLKVTEKYSDNSGSLDVLIEEEPTLEICDLSVICEDNKMIGLKLSSAIFEYTDPYSGRAYNILNESGVEQIGIALDGNFICPDSISCNNEYNSSISTCLVFDRSGSMVEEYTLNGITKIDALRNSALKFLDKFKKDDEAMLITFSNSVTEEIGWTKDIQQVKNKINGILPQGTTAYFDAAYLGVEKTFSNNNPNKALILLSDGEDNSSFKTENELIAFAQSKNVKIFTIGVNIIQETENSMINISKLTNGTYYKAESPEKLDEVFEKIQKEIFNKECCDIYFKIPAKVQQKTKPYKTKMNLFTFDKKGKVIQKEIEIEIKDSCDFTSGIVIDTDYKSEDFNLVPNPASDLISFEVDLKILQNLKITIFDFNGKLIKEDEIQNLNMGKNNINYNVNYLNKGIYVMQINLNNDILTKKFIIKE